MRVLALVRDLAHTHGEAVNLLQLLEALAHRGHVLDVAWQDQQPRESRRPRHPVWRARFAAGPAADRLRRMTDRMFRVGHTDHSIYWSPPRLLAGLVRRLPARAQRLAGLVDDTLRTVPSVLTAVARTRGDRPDAVLEVRQYGTTWSGPVARLTGAALVCQVNVVIDARPRRDRHLLAPADRIVAVSRFVAGELVRQRIAPAAKVRVVHNGVDPDAYPYADRPEREARLRDLGIDPAERVVLYYGQLNPVKGVETLLDAALHAPRPYRLVVAGRYTDAGYRAVLEPMFAALADAGRPVLRVDHQENVVPLLHAADVVVLPSVREEAFGRVLIEAMSTGRPVVGSRIGGIPEVLENGFEAQLVTPGDPADLARVLDGLLDWRDEDPTLGLRSRARVEESFTLDVAAARMEQVLGEAVAERRRNGTRERRDARVNRRVHPTGTSERVASHG